jgi:hypothetical protein
MNNGFENRIIEAFSKEANDTPEPSRDLIKNARRIVANRKKTTFITRCWNNRLTNRISVYQTGFAALIIAACAIFVSQQKYSGGGFYDIRTQTATTSVNSSTVLSGLTQHTNTNQSVNTTTVLTSILTFVAKN